MKLDKENMKKIAHLSRLALTDEEEQVFLKDLNKILDWMGEISKIDLSETKPLTSMLQEETILRDDKSNRQDQHAVLANAPGGTVEGFFVVPKVIGEK